MQIGYIYKLSAPDTNKIYIGSTNNINRRFSQHKHNFNKNGSTTSKIVMGYPGVKIDVLESLNYNDKKELFLRERHHIKENINNIVNKIHPTRTDHEYYEENKQKLNDHSNTVVICELCYKTYTLRNKSRHYKKYCKPNTIKNTLFILLLLFYINILYANTSWKTFNCKT